MKLCTLKLKGDYGINNEEATTLQASFIQQKQTPVAP